MIQKKLSVLVFIHGGGFRTGSSNSNLFAPTYLLDYDIILVTMNYRLNVLGKWRLLVCVAKMVLSLIRHMYT
jgi:carboxylesterase type B